MKRISNIFILMFCIYQFALSQVPSDRNALLNGDEGTQAKIAEMLSYPSPKQILDLASTLKLTDAQRKQLRIIYNEMHTRAQQLGKQIVKIEGELDEAFKAGFVNEKSVADDAEQIGKLRGKLRGVFLAAHVQTKNILTASQIDMYKKLGGAEGKK